MPAELSRALTHLKKEAVSIIGSGRNNAQPVADELGERLIPAEGQPPIDLVAFQLDLVRMVETELGRVEDLDESHVSELDEDREQMDERDSAFDHLTDQLSAVQDACDGVYGTKASRKLFSKIESLPRDPVELTKLGRRIHGRLADPEYPFPEPRLRGWALGERDTLASDLGDAVDRLDEAWGLLNNERKSSDTSLSVKSGAVDGFRQTLRYVAGCLASLYGLAGLHDLAAKIRPKRRRRPRQDGDGDEPAEGTAPAAATTAAAEPPSGGGEAVARGSGDTPEPPPGPRLVVS